MEVSFRIVSLTIRDQRSSSSAIHGFVYDAATRSPIVGATIGIDTTSKIVTSFEAGEYWRLINIGNYTVRASVFDGKKGSHTKVAISINGWLVCAYFESILRRR